MEIHLIFNRFPRPYYIGVHCNTIVFNDNCTFYLTVTTTNDKQLNIDSPKKRSIFATFIGLIVETLLGLL